MVCPLLHSYLGNEFFHMNDHVNYKELIKEKTNTWNIREDLKGLELEEVQYLQPKLPFSVCCANILGDLNVGNIVRSSVIFGATEVFITGRMKLDKRSFVGAENYIKINRFDFLKNETEIDYDQTIAEIVAAGYQPVFVEDSPKAISYSDIPTNYNPCFIFGNEGFGIPNGVIDNYKGIPCVSIKQIGVMRSLNVSAAAAIVINNFSERVREAV
jgi:tRNA G18 (ribose-2'-O)-methylase SpoU